MSHVILYGIICCDKKKKNKKPSGKCLNQWQSWSNIPHTISTTLSVSQETSSNPTHIGETLPPTAHNTPICRDSSKPSSCELCPRSVLHLHSGPCTSFITEKRTLPHPTVVPASREPGSNLTHIAAADQHTTLQPTVLPDPQVACSNPRHTVPPAYPEAYSNMRYSGKLTRWQKASTRI